MVKKGLKTCSLFIIFSLVLSINFIYASTMTLTGASSGSPGSTVNITVGGDFTGRVNISVSNGSGSTSVWIENETKQISVVLGTSGSTGVTATTASGTSDSAGNIISQLSKSMTINIVVPTPVTPPPASNNNNNTNPNTNINNNTNNNNTSSKSSNANLKNMILSVEGLSPAFSKSITAYSLNVGEGINSIDVTATVEHSRASYSVSGNKDLKVGENTISVRVTAEDGTVKTYKIIVLKSDNPEKVDATLSSLIIEDVDLGQDFDPNVTEYNLGDISVKDKKLNILAYAKNEKAKVEIIGNENLDKGEHTITIRVTSENGEVTRDYVITFNKLYSDKDVEIYSDSLKDSENENGIFDKIKEIYGDILKENMPVILLYFFVWFEFLQVVYLYEQLRKEKAKNSGEQVDNVENENSKEETGKKTKARRITSRTEAVSNKITSEDYKTKSPEESNPNSDVNKEIEEIKSKISPEERKEDETIMAQNEDDKKHEKEASEENE